MQSLVRIGVLWMLAANYVSSAFAQTAVESHPLELEASDGVAVFGSVYGTPSAARALLVLFHQGGANAAAEYGPLIPRLIANGYAALAIDQRAGGTILGGVNRTANEFGREAHYCEAYPDLLIALDYARRIAGDRPIIAWGSSYSGALTLRLGGEHEDLTGILAFSPAGGEPMGECPASLFAANVKVPTLVLRPASEVANPNARRDWDAWEELGFELHVAQPGVHGSSMLNSARVEGDVEPSWEVVLEYLGRITDSR